MRELSLHILDIMMNAIEAKAGRIVLAIQEEITENYLRIRLRDNGDGIPADFDVSDPFTTSRKERTVGLGIPLLRQASLECDGHFDIRSKCGKGTELDIGFEMEHINRAPLGEIEDTIVNISICSMNIHLGYLHKTEFGRFFFDSYSIFSPSELQQQVPYELVRPLKAYLRQELQRIKSSA